MRFLKEYPDESDEVTHVSIITRNEWKIMKTRRLGDCSPGAWGGF